MEVAVKAGDFAKAIAEYDTLPETPKAAGQAFADKIRARLAAEELVDQGDRRRDEGGLRASQR